MRFANAWSLSAIRLREDLVRQQTVTTTESVALGLAAAGVPLLHPYSGLLDHETWKVRRGAEARAAEGR